MDNKVLQIVEPGRAEWIAADIPTPEPDEVLVKVSGITTCPHWDMRIYSGTPMFESRPLTFPYIPGEPGHEACGVVESYGSNVTGLAEGDDVVMWRDPGNRVQGCYARYVAVKANQVLKLPTRLPPERIASLELAMCVQVSFDQLLSVDAVDGKHVAVGGMGPAGLIAIQMAKAYGARKVTGTDLLDERRALALKIGADAAIHPDNLPENHVDGDFDSGLDTTGLSIAINQLIKATKKTVAVFGVMREPIEFGPEHWWGGFTLMGYGEHNASAAQRALDLVINGKLELSHLVSATLPMTQYGKGVEMLKSKEAIKVLFDPWAE